MSAKFTGSDRAFDVIKKMIKKWEDHRSGPMEEFAEFVIVNGVLNMDDALRDFFADRKTGESNDTA